MLPTSRNTTYVGGTPVKATDLNDIQDCLIGSKHGDRELVLSGANVVPSNANFSRGVASGAIASTGAIEFHVGIPLRVGDRIKSVVFARTGDGVVDISAEVFIANANGTQTSITPGGPVLVNNVSAAAWADTVIDLTDTVIATRKSAYLRITANGANFSLNNIGVTYDRP